jgi:hypothetical protein
MYYDEIKPRFLPDFDDRKVEQSTVLPTRLVHTKDVNTDNLKVENLKIIETKSDIKIKNYAILSYS